MTTNWYSEDTCFDRSDESELAVLTLKYNRSLEWQLNQICGRL